MLIFVALVAVIVVVVSVPVCMDVAVLVVDEICRSQVPHNFGHVSFAINSSTQSSETANAHISSSVHLVVDVTGANVVDGIIVVEEVVVKELVVEVPQTPHLIGHSRRALGSVSQS